MKLPRVRYSPEGAVLLTWSGVTQYADVITLNRHFIIKEYFHITFGSDLMCSIDIKEIRNSCVWGSNF